MKIYTKTGDTGKTSLIGGRRVSKSDERIEAYGTVDELIAYLGLLRDTFPNPRYTELIIKIQDRLMVAASLLAADSEEFEQGLPKLREEDVKLLENEIDIIDEKLPALNSFILPGGHPAVSTCHICRTICRRAERKTIFLSEHSYTDPFIIKYLNRLSDFLFVFSRLISSELQVIEIPWKPEL
jgi:cob(I)alamin adenosyltransferase